jgi:hypothetical protein
MGKRFTIGIDAGRRTGVAVFDRAQRRLVYLGTLDYFGAREYLKKNFAPGECDVLIEDPTRLRPAFLRPTSLSDEAAAQRVQMHIAQKVGAVKQLTALLIEDLRRLGYNVVPVAPQPKRQRAKNDARQFKLRTGWPGASNEHTRDAAMLCYGVMSVAQPVPVRVQPFPARRRARRS